MEHLNILTLHIAVKVFVRAQGFEIDEADAVVAGVPQQIELAQTAKLVDPQTGEVALLFAYVRCPGDFDDRHIDPASDIILEALVNTDKSSSLTDIPAHALAAGRGTKGTLSSRGSAILIKLSATREAGRSGLSNAARPTLAQNSTRP